MPGSFFQDRRGLARSLLAPSILRHCDFKVRRGRHAGQDCHHQGPVSADHSRSRCAGPCLSREKGFNTLVSMKGFGGVPRNSLVSFSLCGEGYNFHDRWMGLDPRMVARTGRSQASSNRIGLARFAPNVGQVHPLHTFGKLILSISFAEMRGLGCGCDSLLQVWNSTRTEFDTPGSDG